MGRSVLSVLAGFAVMFVLNWTCACPVFWLAPGLSRPENLSQPATLVVLASYTLASAVVGGFWTAWTAQRAELAHAFGLAAVVAILSGALFVRDLEHHVGPRLILLAAAIVGVLLGGGLRWLQVARSGRDQEKLPASDSPEVSGDTEAPPP